MEHKQFIVNTIYYTVFKHKIEEHNTYIFLLIYRNLYNRDYGNEWVHAEYERKGGKTFIRI